MLAVAAVAGNGDQCPLMVANLFDKCDFICAFSFRILSSSFRWTQKIATEYSEMMPARAPSPV